MTGGNGRSGVAGDKCAHLSTANLLCAFVRPTCGRSHSGAWDTLISGKVPAGGGGGPAQTDRTGKA